MLLLQAQQVARHFGADILFENVNLDIKDNSKIALVGRNGAGKSTLIKMLIGESLPDEGKIVTKRDLTIGYLAQHTGLESTKNVLDEMLSVFEPLQKMEAKIHQLEEKIASPSIPHESKEYQQLLNQYDQLQHDFQENNGYGYENEVTAVLHGFQFFENDYGTNNHKGPGTLLGRAPGGNHFGAGTLRTEGSESSQGISCQNPHCSCEQKLRRPAYS